MTGKIEGLERFEDVTADARLALSRDSGHLVAMCQNASSILWDLRKDLRAAASAAVEECAEDSFTGQTTSPCGTSAGCRFAKGDLTRHNLPELPGKLERPQPRPGHSSYDPEQALRPLLALRERSRRPT